MSFSYGDRKTQGIALIDSRNAEELSAVEADPFQSLHYAILRYGYLPNF